MSAEIEYACGCIGIDSGLQGTVHGGLRVAQRHVRGGHAQQGGSRGYGELARAQGGAGAEEQGARADGGGTRVGALPRDGHRAGAYLVEDALVGAAVVAEGAVEGEVTVGLEAVAHVPRVAAVDGCLALEVGDGLYELSLAGELAYGE